MSVAVRNKYGAIAVNKGVIERMIVSDLLGMHDMLMLSDKKGRPIKEKPTPLIDPDYFDAVEVSDKKGQVSVKIYIIIKQGNNIAEAADLIFRSVESEFDLLRLAKPDAINVKIRGLFRESSDEITKKNIDIVRDNR